MKFAVLPFAALFAVAAPSSPPPAAKPSVSPRANRGPGMMYLGNWSRDGGFEIALQDVLRELGVRYIRGFCNYLQ